MITQPAYCNRTDVRREADFKFTMYDLPKIDRNIVAASRKIDRMLHRRFFPVDETNSWDWPNFQRAYPWRIWFDGRELADVTVNVPVLTSGGNVIPAGDLLWGPWNLSPPFTFVEINRATSASYGQGSTPQKDVQITGTFGYSIDSDHVANLTAAITDTTAVTVAVSDSSQLDAGDILIVDSERMLVTDRTWASVSTLSGSGCTSALASDNLLTLASGTLFVSEIAQVDAERMLVVDTSGSSYVVKRAFDGTVLATHTAGATVSAGRSLTVTRGALGTTAATHSNNAAALKHRVPDLIKELAVAEAVVAVAQGSAGYSSDDMGGRPNVTGEGLADLWEEARESYGRQMRTRVV